MALIDLFGIKKRFETKVLLDGVDFHLHEGERVALFGQNGTGKSTLLKIITGKEEQDSGKVVKDQSIEIAMLEQIPRFDEDITVARAIEQNLQDLTRAKSEYERISMQLAKDFENKTLLAQHHELGSYLDFHDAWNLENKIQRVLSEFDLKQYEHRPVISLSGGEQRRVALGALILKKPDVLILDEPTNHLDVYMTEFLEKILLDQNFTLIFISHDRYFIDHLATRIVEVDDCDLISYSGGYESYLQKKEARMKALQKQHENLLRLLRDEEQWLATGVKARLKRDEGRKQRVYELREEARKNPAAIKKMKIQLEREKLHFLGEKKDNKKKMLFEIEHLCFAIDGKQLLHDFSTRILQRDKIAVVGKNGSGKSSFLKLLLGRMRPDGGVIKKGDITIGYFDQHREMLDDNKTLIETFCPNGGDTIEVEGRNMHVYGYLKNFLFPKEHLTKKVGILSGGEKNRVALALLFTKKVDCLILDEPTNDLDIPTINILEQKLLNFKGALLFVSHDRYFVDKIANKLFIFKGRGRVEQSQSSYSQYLELEKEIHDLDTMQETDTQPKAQKPKQKNSKLSYKDKLALEELPVQIEALEAKIDELTGCLSDPECYKQKGLQETSDELDSVQKEYDNKAESYLQLLEKQEEIEG
ncbi:MAG: ABC-F family ATP-binding cassette domain-containing protein [Campylobacterota bacterium]